MLISICDNEPEELASLQDCLVQAAAGMSVSIRLAPYRSGETLVDAVKEGMRPALAVLDIYMDGMGGIETGRRLREILPELPLAFLTASRDFAVDAFALDALHYIVKPMTVDAACVLLKRLEARPRKPAPLLEMPAQQGGTAQFSVREVSRVVSKSRGVEIYLQGRGPVWFACQFWKVAEQLSSDPDFLLVSRGCLVNMNCVQRIDVDTCFLKDGGCLPVSRRERLNVKARYNDFLFRQLDRIKGAVL